MRERVHTRARDTALLVLVGILCASASGQNFPSFRPVEYPRYPAAGSTYVPLESWVYPALERLAALRYISSDFRGMKPWTRIECARLTDEAGKKITAAIREDRPPGESIARLYTSLRREFASELDILGGGDNRSLHLGKVYARMLSLSGPVLNDSYHFGQTISNDYGRPFRRGTNVVTGASARATYGRFFAYGRAEFQHAPSAPAVSQSQRNFIAQQDSLPVKPAKPFEQVNRLRLLDTYAGVNVGNWQISYGRQSLWWGTSESGGLLFSNNAEPVNMFRINRVVPFRLPSVLGFFGPIRIDFIVGRLGGHEVASHPWIQGQRISFKLTRNFEFAATHTAQFAGEGRPGGIGTFFKTLFAFRELKREFQGGPSLSNQELSFDFLYRFGRYATWYAELLASDNVQPFDTPSRDAVNTGVYFPRLPWLSKLDLRLESFYTKSPCEPNCATGADGRESAPASFLHYFHSTYRSGYTNDGFILGNSIGRDGIGFQGWLTYWFSPLSRLQFSVRRAELSPDYMPGGANWYDISVRHARQFRSGFYVSSVLQVERLRYPFLFPGLRTNVAASMEFGYTFGERP